MFWSFRRHHAVIFAGWAWLAGHVTLKNKMALWRCVKRGSWKTWIDASIRSNAVSSGSEPRFLSTAGDIRNRISLTGRVNNRAFLQPVSWYSTHRPVQREKPNDMYFILGVTPSATQQQVKEAYYKLSLKYHPDRNMGSQEAHEKFTALTEAYSILGQYELRKKYDKGLLHHYPGRHHTTHQYV